MSLNPLYVVAPNIQYYFVDRDTGAPLSQGKVFFYRDVDMITPKAVYELQGNSANYTYSPLPNPIILSSVGTIVDDNGNQVIPYFKPFDENGDEDLYYIVVQNAVGAPQFTVHAWPNPQGGTTPIGDNNTVNYVPNGQFLAHTNLQNNELVPGSNVIAQGGFSIELDDGATSENTLSWIFQQPTQEPPQSPRWVADFICVNSVSSETNKSFRLKFRDVNKFNDEGPFTFAFWAQATGTVPITVAVVKYFGSGDSSGLLAPIPMSSGDITTSPPVNGLYNYSINFGSNEGFIVGPNDDDWIAIDIIFPTDIQFNVKLCDFVLIYGNEALVETFPLQTNANMLANGVAGWMTSPNPDGSDLFCPLVLTREGMQFDHSGIGMIYASPSAVPAPSSSTSTTNLLPCDGATYVSSDYSFLGIPYTRLANYLTAASGIGHYPAYGTGADFATGWTDTGISPNTSFYVVVNAPGTPVAIASNGTIGWTFDPVMTYGSTQIGSSAIYPTASWNQSSLFQAIGTLTTASVTDGTPGTGFGLTLFDAATGLFSQQATNGFYGTAISAASLAVGSGQCKYFNFVYNSITYKVQYRIASTGTVTTGTNDITIDLPSTAAASTVAQMTAYALQGLQVSRITATTHPGTGLTAGQYWSFQTNPSATKYFYVWYTINGIGSKPVATGTAIQVDLLSTDTIAQVVTKTYAAINFYQVSVPDLEGMFLRGYDSTPTWDADKATRFSQGTGPGGTFGSYEYGQFESHLHGATSNSVSSTTILQRNGSGTSQEPQRASTASATFSSSSLLQGSTTTTTTTTISDAGGNETRPVNSYVNWVMKY